MEVERRYESVDVESASNFTASGAVLLDVRCAAAGPDRKGQPPRRAAQRCRRQTVNSQAPTAAAAFRPPLSLGSEGPSPAMGGLRGQLSDVQISHTLISISAPQVRSLLPPAGRRKSLLQATPPAHSTSLSCCNRRRAASTTPTSWSRQASPQHNAELRTHCQPATQLRASDKRLRPAEVAARMPARLPASDKRLLAQLAVAMPTSTHQPPLPRWHQCHQAQPCTLPLPPPLPQVRQAVPDKDGTQLCVTCAGGTRGTSAATAICEEGYGAVACMPGGMKAWVARGLPTTTEGEPAAATAAGDPAAAL